MTQFRHLIAQAAELQHCGVVVKVHSLNHNGLYATGRIAKVSDTEIVVSTSGRSQKGLPRQFRQVVSFSFYFHHIKEIEQTNL